MNLTSHNLFTLLLYNLYILRQLAKQTIYWSRTM